MYCPDTAYNQFSGTFTGVKIYYSHTTRTSLSSTFSDNYSGNTPTLVYSNASLALNWPETTWGQISFNTNFAYNGSNNLLIEIQWDASPAGGLITATTAGTSTKALLGSTVGSTVGTPIDRPVFQLHYTSPPPGPATPIGVYATDGAFADHVEVAWSSAVNAESYAIWRRQGLSDFAGATLIGTTTQTNFVDTTVDPNFMYMYWIRGINSDATSEVSAADSGYAMGANVTNTVPYRESFEGYPTNELVVGRNGWYGQNLTAMTITEAADLINSLASYDGILPLPATNHTRVAEIEGLPLTNRVTGTEGQNTWMDMMLRVTLMADAPVPSEITNSQCAFTVGTNGRVRALSYSLSAGSNTWMEFVHAPVSTSEWIRLSAQLDYHGAHSAYPNRGWFQCWLNGRVLTNSQALTRPDDAGQAGGSWLPMAVTNATRLNALIWKGRGHVDDLTADTTIPDGFARTIHTTADDHGTVSPAGEVLAWNGSDVTVAIQPAPYYSVQSLLVDGISQATATQYVFVAVTNDRTLHASFAANLATNGTPQWWLADYRYSNNWEAAALGDDDHDRLLNWEEYVAGSDPTNGSSVLAVSNLTPLVTGQVVLQWPSVAARVYDVAWTPSLAESFVPVASNLSANPPVNTYTDVVNNASCRFYRIHARFEP